MKGRRRWRRRRRRKRIRRRRRLKVITKYLINWNFRGQWPLVLSSGEILGCLSGLPSEGNLL